MKKLAWTLTLLAALPFALSAQVSKEDLKKLAAAGISDEVILSYVRANGPVVKLSAEDVIELKQAGASEKVLSVALGNAPPPAPAYQPSYDQPVPRQTYTAPSTAYVVNSSPYYYQPSVSYASYVESPYYYPSYAYYGGYYGYPRYYGGAYCGNRYYGGYGLGVGVGYSSGRGVGVGYSSGRGYIGVSGYRAGHR
jgi:hypothetical protein